MFRRVKVKRSILHDFLLNAVLHLKVEQTKLVGLAVFISAFSYLEICDYCA